MPELSNWALFNAIGNDDLAGARHALKNGVDPNTRNENQNTALFEAVDKKNLELTQLLLEYGANPNIGNEYGDTPLHRAAYLGRRDEIVDLLLANNADLNLKRPGDGVTPLYEAVRGRELETAKKLLKEDSDLGIVRSDGKTFLHNAVEYETLEFLDLLNWTEKCPIDVNSVTNDNETPLMGAVNAGSICCVEWLLQRQANVNIKDNDQMTAFLWCARIGNVEIAKLLIQQLPKTIYEVDNEGRGAFHHAAGWGHSHFIEWLCNSHQAPDVNPDQGKTLDPNIVDIYGMTFIHWALDFWEPSIVESCLKFCKPTIVNEVDHKGNTPLHIALNTLSARVEVHSILIESMSLGARRKRNKDGESILSRALRNVVQNAESASEWSSIDAHRKFFMELFKDPLDVEYSESGAWPTIIRTDPHHVMEITKKLEELFKGSPLPEKIIFWAARNGATALVTDGLTGLTDSEEKIKVIAETLYWASVSEQENVVEKIVVGLTADDQGKVGRQKQITEVVLPAAFAGYESIVKFLLFCIRANDTQLPDESSTGLFWALTWKNKDAKDVVRRLLMNGANLNSIAGSNKTILQWAIDYHEEVSRSGTETSGYDMLGLLECPIRVPPRPEAPQKPKAKMKQENEASKHSTTKNKQESGENKHICTISDFYCQDEAFYTLQRRSNCHEVIYKEGVAKKMKDSWNEWFPKDESRMPDFRWVHLPVNDWDLAKDLIDSIYFEITAGTSDLGYTRCKNFVRGTQKEHTGSPQSSFMYPAFHFQTRDQGSGESSTVIQYLDNIAKLLEKKAKGDQEKNKQKSNSKDNKTAKHAKEDAGALTQNKNPTSGNQGSKTTNKATTPEGVSHERTEDHMPLNHTPGRNEDTDHPDSSLTDASIKKESRFDTIGADEPGRSKDLSGNAEQSPESGSRPQESEQSKPALGHPSGNGTTGILTTHAELDTRREQNDQRAPQHVAERTKFDANRSSAELSKSGPGEHHPMNLQVPQDGQASDAISTMGDNQSIVSQRETSHDPKNLGGRNQEHPGVDSSPVPALQPDREHSKVTNEQKKQLEKCRVALYMPFLTFQTVKEQRKRRRDNSRSELAARPRLSQENPANKTDPKDYTTQTYMDLSLAAISMLESKSPSCNKLSQEMIFKAIQCSIRSHEAFGQNMDPESAARLLKGHLNFMSKSGEFSSETRRFSFFAKFWKRKSSGSLQNKASSTDMNQAIEYLIDAISLANKADTSRNSLTPPPSNDRLNADPSQDSTNQTDGSADLSSKGRDESTQTRKRHESRTLDQYFYSSLPDTVRRDADQVIVRYQAKKGCSNKEDYEKRLLTNETPRPPPESRRTTDPDPQNSDKTQDKLQAPGYHSNEKNLSYQENFKLCMVDQLWLWVLDDRTIITCFPDTEKNGDQHKDYQKSPLDHICDHINREMRPQIRNVYHLAALITSFCANSIDKCQARIGSGEERLLDMFSESIGLVADKEVMLFNSFKNRLGSDVRDLKLEDDIELLEEIKDIRDELNILERILDDQADLTQKLFNLFDVEKREGTITNSLQDQVLQYYQQRAGVELRLDRIKKMDEDAKISYDAINFLLDLKQKHANVMEAKAAREQAESTADQGRTVLIFTIVTIVFAPLSFLCSFFALNIESFPRMDGDISFPNSWIYWRVYGISVAIFVPLIVGTLAYGPMKTVWKRQESSRQGFLSSDRNTKAMLMENAINMEAANSHFNDQVTKLTRNRLRPRKAQGPSP
ncbi:hypothetical protein PENCOP_c005G04768 [Penicillium coprophilum]|uniref:Uncharacterized protein n=1 Tax=Penicillium coprophilum TaxID=36646 RepID=A0A1V6URM4_9EURO|nr:hypothetical protein PENCOP_c005G04768 [Penicillium coprophilum]